MYSFSRRRSEHRADAAAPDYSLQMSALFALFAVFAPWRETCLTPKRKAAKVAKRRYNGNGRTELQTAIKQDDSKKLS
ncbi:MAG TPA: hypothetical protein VNO70_24950 [Blastocatellia bacterium]|nr:hypothetical protein [Blastocatellia bacterium]